MLPPAGDGDTWQDFGHVLTLLDNYHNSRLRIVELLVSSVPCASGCCNMAVSVRPNSTDITVLRQIMSNTDYSFLNDLDWEPKMILDAGANFGGSSLLFAALFPDATIVSLEPAALDFELLKINSARFKNIIPLNVGLWDKVSGLKIPEEECGERLTALCGHWGYKVQDATAMDTDVTSITMAGAAAVADTTGFEFVKMDIEGSEAGILTDLAASPWLENVLLLSVDVHRAAGADLELQVNSFFGNSHEPSRSGRFNVFKKANQKQVLLEAPS